MAVHIVGTIKSISDVEAHLFVIMKSKSDVVIYFIGIIVRVNQNKPIHWLGSFCTQIWWRHMATEYESFMYIR